MPELHIVDKTFMGEVDSITRSIKEDEVKIISRDPRFSVALMSFEPGECAAVEPGMQVKIYVRVLAPERLIP